jgi:hypothetical protein
MEQEKKNVIYVVVALIVLILLGMWIFGSKGAETPSASQAEGTTPPPPPPSVTVQVNLTPEEKSGNVDGKKAQILARIRSNTPLTVAEKQEIQLIMATKANIYQWTEDERKEIFGAFNQ